MNNKITLTESDLIYFTGTENYYRHPLIRKVCYTDGIKYVADAGNARWLIDEIAIQQINRSISAEGFQVWTLKVNEDKTAVFTCDDGNENTIYREEINYTTFPLDEIKLYCIDNVILLPSEY